MTILDIHHMLHKKLMLHSVAKHAFVLCTEAKLQLNSKGVLHVQTCSLKDYIMNNMHLIYGI
jgi:hypothetical protein